MLPKIMMVLQLLSLSLILTMVNSQDWTTTDDFLVFKVGDYDIYFNKCNATEFFRCICSNHFSCTNYMNQIQVYNTIFDNTIYNDTSGPYHCSLDSKFKSDGLFVCSKEAPPAVFNTSVTQLKTNGCLNFFNNVTCDSNNASLTWMECNYSVMCLVNDTAYFNETHIFPGSNGNTPTNCRNISDLTPFAMTSPESTTGNNKQSSPATNSTDVFKPNSDSKLTLIISITVSVGAVLLISIIAATVLLFKRRKVQAKMNMASYQHPTDADDGKTTDHYDTYTKSETARVIEPYSVVTLNEHSITEDLSNPRKCNVIVEGNTNLYNDIEPTTFTETKYGCRANVTEFSEMAKRDENAKWKRDHGNNLQEVGHSTLLELHPKADTLQDVVSDKEHIYFELETESITNNHQDDKIHQ